MDTSETYVKMCEKAFKDLKRPLRSIINNEPQCVDRLTLWARRYPNGTYFTWMSTNPFEDSFPIYGQDQLQEMVDFSKFQMTLFKNSKGDWSFSVEKRIEDGGDGFGRTAYWVDGSSMEQLWLVFVMGEKFGKTWNGMDWIKKE